MLATHWAEREASRLHLQRQAKPQAAALLLLLQEVHLASLRDGRKVQTGKLRGSRQRADQRGPQSEQQISTSTCDIQLSARFLQRQRQRSPDRHQETTYGR